MIPDRDLLVADGLNAVQVDDKRFVNPVKGEVLELIFNGLKRHFGNDRLWLIR